MRRRHFDVRRTRHLEDAAHRPLLLASRPRREEPHMITIESLSKKYGGRTVVDDVSFTARPGRVTGFLGPNGAGKSVSMRMMVGLTQPRSEEHTSELQSRNISYAVFCL